MSGPTCIECGGEGQLVTGELIYPHRPDLWKKSFYRCACGAYCGCHPDTTIPLGSPCGAPTRKARSAAHAVFDVLWKKKLLLRADAYKRLADELGMDRKHCHIGMMSIEQAQRVPAATLRIQATIGERAC